MKKEIVIDYGENTAAETLLWLLNEGNKNLTKYSIFVPMSRQQKGIDLILYKNGSSKIATIQVKSSRSYVGDKGDKTQKTNYLWLNTFSIKDDAKADFYLIVGRYYATNQKLDIRSGCALNLADYKPMILLYTYDEMKEELSKIRQAKTEKQDRFFSYSFRDENDIKLERGFFNGYNTINGGKEDRNNYVLEKRISDIKKFFN